MAKTKKFDFKKIAISTITAGVTGAIANIASDAVSATNPDIVDYGMIIGGALLPEFVKNEMVETAGTALIAVGAFKLAERNDLAGKLGITKSPTTTGLNDFRNIGATPWKPNYGKKEGKAPKAGSNVQ